MDTERSESKGTPKQEADLQRHLRHQKGMRSRQESPATSATMRILGVLLRFLGMAVIIVSAFLIFLSQGTDGGPLILALVGAGMHFAGRKLAPGTHAASVTGGVAGVGSIALIVAVILGFLFIISHPADVLGWVWAFLTGNFF